ncbi:MAG: site-specific integrase [Bacteroidaceae bacterium]|nr:site-specific integrase [Bacteroidaceae bacterium]
MAEKVQKRNNRDKSKVTLRKGEQQRPNGTYAYRWTDEYGKRRAVYAETLEELRAAEDSITKDRRDSIKAEARYVTVNDLFELWKQIKRGLKDNTYQNYQYMYGMFVAPTFGKKRIADVMKSDVKRFYNTLVDERGLSISTVDSIHTVLHQVLDMAVDDAYIRNNPADNVLKELKQTHVKQDERRALTKAEQELFLNFLKRSDKFRHWYPIFAVMVGTGMRVGEVIGLRWCDIDLEDGVIDVNHTLVYYKHAQNGCYFNIHTPKTRNGIRKIPMLKFVRDALMEERRNQFEKGVRCQTVIDGYTDFVFLNRFGQPHNQGTLNKALRRIMRDCNDEILCKEKPDPVLLPHFSCHILRHTFATRMCEAGVNIKVIQETLGHADVSTTLNIYADATKDLKRAEFAGFEKYWTETGSN